MVRAYQKSVQEGLANAKIIEKRKGAILHIRTDYTGIGKLQYLFGQNQIEVIDTEYAADVLTKALIPVEQKAFIEKAITEQTSGTAGLEWGEDVIYAQIGKEVKIFSES